MYEYLFEIDCILPVVGGAVTGPGPLGGGDGGTKEDVA